LLFALSCLIAVACLELALRLYHGELTRGSSLLRPPLSRSSTPAASFDAQLGWVPRTGVYVRSPSENWTITPAGFRSNGAAVSRSGRPILVVGDSFTFGDEVLDHETWPARLEELMDVPVLNAGVFAYGIDQAFLRARQLLEVHKPAFLLLGFIGHDVHRAEMDFYGGWKPYFEFQDGKLTLRNVPVPEGAGPAPRFPKVRTILGYSFVANAVFNRLAPEWWYPPSLSIRHSDGDRIAVELLAELNALATRHGGHLTAIAFPANRRLQGNARSRNVAELARQRNIDVLNLIPEIEQLSPEAAAALFQPRGHYTPSMNLHVATRVRTHLATRGSSMP
jgi:hypothetical protein